MSRKAPIQLGAMLMQWH